LKGYYREPEVRGTLTVKSVIYKGFTLADSYCNIDIELKDWEKNVQVFGKVFMEKGIFQTKKVLINLESGKIEFPGPWDNPLFEFRGNSTIEKTRIAIGLKGTKKEPHLSLSSEPSYSKEKLMVMLSTGKSWQSVENSLAAGVLSSDLTLDFIDYFFFAGKANIFAKKFGVKEFTVTLNEQAQGVGAKKDLTEKLEIGYDIERKGTQAGENALSQQVQAGYQLTDQLLFGFEKEIIKKQTDALLNESSSETKSEEGVYLKYKKSF
jgi:hypothetical protein